MLLSLLLPYTRTLLGSVAVSQHSGAVQAGLIGFGLFVFASKVEGIVYSQDLPAGYTVRLAGWAGKQRVCRAAGEDRGLRIEAAARNTEPKAQLKTLLTRCVTLMPLNHPHVFTLPPLLPTQQARNIAITVRTIIVGLLYLATFIFSANAVGLSGVCPVSDPRMSLADTVDVLVRPPAFYLTCAPLPPSN